jgi:ribonucleoside-diphosphate reductase alpha subunit
MATASDFNNMQGGGIASTDSYAKLLKIFHELCADLRLSKEEIASVVSISIAGCPISDEVSSRALWQLASETAAAMTTEHPDFGVLAARILVRQLQQEIPQTFSDAIIALHEQGAISSQLYSFVLQHRNSIDSAICYSRDYAFDYFGFKTLEKSYLLRSPGGTILESPQYLFMRVALALHLDNITAALESYESMSQHQFIHASPTLFNAGTRNGQLSSCFLLHSPCDSIEGIFKTISDCALISKGAGGIGLSASGIRSRGSYIRGTKGFSSGLVPMLRVFDATAKYVDQGGGKRPGAFAVYLEPWHADIFDFLLLRKNSGKEEARARDLFYGLWIPDLFMHRVASDGNWSLMCPHECPGLDDCWGAEFERKYEVYEREGRAKKQVRARDLWNAIIDAQLETGTPYMLYKDSCNQKSNQKNLGTIKCSNLCTEIIEFTAPNETAVCNLASIVLPKCVEVDQNGTVSFNFGKLMSVTRIVTRNLNNIIDLTIYPVPEAKTSNRRHRPIGIGVQGLADVFQVMGFPFESVEARTLNKAIFESIYFAALDASCDLAKQSGPYESYQGSPASLGILQHDLWRQDGAFSRNSTTTILDHGTVLDWPALRNRIARYGLRNSLLVAPMPTASTAQILGNNECFEPYTRYLLLLFCTHSLI